MKNLLPILVSLFLLTTESNGQSALSVGQVYDFNINDEFHYWLVEPPPNGDRIKIIHKYFSPLNDTVFYIRQCDNYYSEGQWNNWEYFFNSFIDTVFYTNLDSLIFNPDSSMIDDSTAWFSDTSFTSSQWCGQLVYQYSYGDIYSPGYSWCYGQGLGMVEYHNWYNGFPNYDHRYIMHYYKKDTIECGSRDTTTMSINQPESYEKRILLYPNPASNQIYIQSPIFEKCDVCIYNAIGQLVLSIADSRLDMPVDIRALTPGLYLIKIVKGFDVYGASFIKE